MAPCRKLYIYILPASQMPALLRSEF